MSYNWAVLMSSITFNWLKLAYSINIWIMKVTWSPLQVKLLFMNWGKTFCYIKAIKLIAYQTYKYRGFASILRIFYSYGKTVLFKMHCLEWTNCIHFAILYFECWLFSVHARFLINVYFLWANKTFSRNSIGWYKIRYFTIKPQFSVH